MTVTSPAVLPDTAGPLRMTPGRWLALAVAVPVAVALIGWTGFSLVSSTARGSYPFSYSVPVQDGQLALNDSAGNVTLREAPASSSARLTGTVKYGLFRPDISESGTPTGANLGVDCAAVVSGDCWVNAALSVPARTAITLWSNGGNIAASGFSSGMTLWAGGGNVTASNLAGNLQLDTGGGDLAADGLTGDLQLATEGGNVDASGVSSAAASMQSGGGDVTLTFTQAPENLQITAEGGNVTVILPPGDTTYDIATPDTGGGNVSYPSSLADSASHRTITVDSGGGDITISQG